jgi:hypothetical protein
LADSVATVFSTDANAVLLWAVWAAVAGCAWAGGISA